MREKTTFEAGRGVQVEPRPGLVLALGVLIGGFDEASFDPELSKRIAACTPDLRSTNAVEAAQMLGLRLAEDEPILEQHRERLARADQPGPHDLPGGASVMELLTPESREHLQRRCAALTIQVKVIRKWLSDAQKLAADTPRTPTPFERRRAARVAANGGK